MTRACGSWKGMGLPPGVGREVTDHGVLALGGGGGASGNRRHLKSGRADGWYFLGTERVHHPGHKGQDEAWPEGVLEEIEDIEKADLRWVAQPVQGAQQPHGQHKTDYLLAMSQVCSPYLGIAGRVQGNAQAQGSP